MPAAATPTSMCPANMLAKSRTAMVNGRRMMFDRNSIGISRMCMAHGIPGMNVCSLR